MFMALSTREAADRILDGNLSAWIAERRKRGESFNDVARALLLQHNVEVTAETVRLWCKADAESESAA